MKSRKMSPNNLIVLKGTIIFHELLPDTVDSPNNNFDFVAIFSLVHWPVQFYALHENLMDVIPSGLFDLTISL